MNARALTQTTNELKDTLKQLGVADDLLKQKYAEFAGIGKEKKEDSNQGTPKPGRQIRNTLTFIKKTLTSKSGLTKHSKSMDGISSLLSLKADEGDARETQVLPRQVNETMQSKKDLSDNRFHRFQPHNYRSSKKCDVCQESLKGKELRCETCGFHSHTKCDNGAAGMCLPGKKPASTQDAAVSSTSLITHAKDTPSGVPAFIIECIEEVELKGIILG